MKKATILFSVIASVLALFAATSTPNGFTDDLDAALEAAKKSGKTVYAVFSGSDWCYWCKLLEKDYLSQASFVKEASKSFELVYIDSPRDKSKLSEKAAARNPELVKKYEIRGFPSVRFINADGSASIAARPQKGMTPTEYAISLSKGKVSKPSADSPLAPFEQEFEMLQKETMKSLMNIGDPFSKTTPAEQKAAYKKGVSVMKGGVSKMRNFRSRIISKKVPSEVAQSKADLIKKVDASIEKGLKFSKMSFNDAKKLRASWF